MFFTAAMVLKEQVIAGTSIGQKALVVTVPESFNIGWQILVPLIVAFGLWSARQMYQIWSSHQQLKDSKKCTERHMQVKQDLMEQISSMCKTRSAKCQEMFMEGDGSFEDLRSIMKMFDKERQTRWAWLMDQILEMKAALLVLADQQEMKPEDFNKKVHAMKNAMGSPNFNINKETS